MTDPYAAHPIPACCVGERCIRCGRQAHHKIGEEMFDDDPQPIRHGLSSYLCCWHFREAMGATGTPWCVPEGWDYKSEPSYQSSPTTADLATLSDRMGERIRRDTQRAIERFDGAADGAGWAIEREGPGPPVTMVDALLSFGLGLCAILTGLALLRFAGPQMVVPTAIGCLLGVWAMVVGARQLAREWRTR